MALPWGTSTVIEQCVKNALEVCSRIILVTGYRSTELADLFRSNERVEVKYNHNYSSGMLTSVMVGMSSVETARFFIALGDMPLVGSEVFETLLQYPDIDAVIPKYQGKKGHPVLLKKKIFQNISLSTTTSATTSTSTSTTANSLRDVLAQVATLAVPVSSAAILHDIDNFQDYKKLSGHIP